MRRRILVIENDSIVDDEVDVVLETLYSDEDTEVKEINFAKDNPLDVLLTSEVYSKLTKDDDEFIILGMSTFGDLSQVSLLLTHFSKLPKLPKLQFVFARQFVEKIRDRRVWGMTDELVDIIETFIGKGLVYDVEVDLSNNEIVLVKLD